jgi:hypothetical protein
LVPRLHWLTTAPLYLTAIMSGILAPIVLSLLVALIPKILRKLSQFKGFHNKQRIEIEVQRTLFAFLFIQSFLVVTLSQGIAPVFDQAIHAPTTIPYLLSTNLPKASNFFLSYIVIQGLGVSAGLLLRPMDLLKVCKDRLNFSTKTPRQVYANLSAPAHASLQWAEELPFMSNLAAITIIYAPIQPLILPCSLISFACFCFAYRYRILYCNGMCGVGRASAHSSFPLANQSV